MIANNKRNGFGRVGLILVLPFILLVLAFFIYKIFFISDPLVSGIEALELLSAEKTVKLRAENIKSITINVLQGDKKIELLNDTPENGEKTYTLNIKPGELKLKDEPAVIVIDATAGFFKEVSYKVTAEIDTVPPQLEVQRAPSFIHQGSAGLAVLRARGADSVYVKLGDLTFPAFEAASQIEERLEDMAAQGKAGRKRKTPPTIYHVFFPATFDIEEGSIYYAIAVDNAGNQQVRALSTKLKIKEHKVSAITIDDSFINTVVTPLLNVTEITDPAAAFKTVNENWRGESLEKIIDISSTTEPNILWEGRFLQMRNSKVMATYGEKREYVYDGDVISRSAHLGYDLASYAQSPVTASNSGIVRFSDDLSIYGETVIIDHGLGLMTIYGHLSSLLVSEGDTVQKGDLIGKTGASGLAGGDHLHFGILVHGYEVSPLYWWDPKWVNVNITNHLSN